MNQAPPGWYSNPAQPNGLSYWNGQAWDQPPPVVPFKKPNPAAAIGVCVLAVIGFVMSIQSVSLLTGTGQLWTGVGIAAIGAAGALILRTATWSRITTVALLALSLVAVLYMENQLSERREQLFSLIQ